MAIPVIFPTLAPNAASQSTEAAEADKLRRPSLPSIKAVMPYARIRPRHKDRERDRRQAAFEAWIGSREGEMCLIGSNPSMSRRMNVISQRYQSADDDDSLELSVEV